jgi:HEAT repeat protein
MANKLCALTLAILAMLLVGCGEKDARDFNELIPRLLKPVNTYNNPEEAASNLFNVTSPDERRDAIAYLANKPYGFEPPYMKAYFLLSRDPHSMVRAQAMRALGASHKKEAIPYLINGNTGKTGLADSEAEVRRDAAVGLTENFDPSAIPALIDHVQKDTDDQTRVACARALKNAKTPEVYRALIAAMDDRDAAVVYAARQALITNTGQNLGYDPKAWLNWYAKTYPPTTQPAGT